MPASELSPALRAHLEVTYDLLGQLGEGGMGVVWHGRDRLLDREVAIKVLRFGAEADAASAQRFLQEARVAARLQHPGVVPLLTFGEVGTERYYVMPYVRGETLEDRLRRGPLPESDVRRIIAEVADALEYVHARGIVHRDVKPANILLEAETGRAVLADFGIARDGGNGLTATGVVVGTPRYLAPEQATGGAEPVNGRADIYSLGLVAWEALTGRTPFGGGSVHELLARKMTGAIVPAKDPVPALPPVLADAVMRAIAPREEDRWQTAASFAAALRSEAEAYLDPPDLRPIMAAGSIWALASLPIGLGFVGVGAGSELGLVSRIVLPLLGGIGMGALLAAGRITSLRSEYAPTRSWREVLRVAFRPPAWWWTSWPAPLRGFFVADHLPPAASRAVRRMAHMSVAVLPFAAFTAAGVAVHAVATPDEMAAILQQPWYRGWQWAMQWLWAGMLGVVAWGVWPMHRVTRRWRAAGLGKMEIQRLFNRLYDPEALKNPTLARIRGIEMSADEPSTIDALATAIAGEAAALRAAGWSLDETNGTVARLRSADHAWAAEERELAAAADPVEAGRLRDRLERMTAGADELRRLIEEQLRLHDTAERRLTSLRQQRERARELAALVLRQLRTMRARDRASADVSELDVTARLRDLARNLEHLEAGRQDASRIAPTSHAVRTG